MIPLHNAYLILIGIRNKISSLHKSNVSCFASVYNTNTDRLSTKYDTLNERNTFNVFILGVAQYVDCRMVIIRLLVRCTYRALGTVVYSEKKLNASNGEISVSGPSHPPVEVVQSY